MSLNKIEDNDTRIILDKSLFESFIQECLQIKIQNISNNPLYPIIIKTRYALTQSSPLNAQSKDIFDRLISNIDKPMKVAIIGQFSSGKSTFLNALLGKEILPSGITPVTAKVCEIVYGEEISLEVFYKNNTIVNKPINYLNEVDDIENSKISYYKLFVPLPLLKEICFLDTPGFNSQNEGDTDTTNRILEEVDGIIWLTLIDNVGKNSEKEILQTHIKKYANKSLCVLNQKDRLKTESEVNTSVEYAKKAFDGFFEEFIAISAKQALDSILIADTTSIKNIHEVFHESLISNNKSSKDIFEDSINFSNDSIYLFKNSNIKSVLDFIYTKIRPKALESKEYRTLRELRTLLVLEKYKLHKVNLTYKELISILNIYTQKLHFNALQSGLDKKFNKLFNILESQFDAISQKIFNSFELKSFIIIRETKNFLGIKSKLEQTKEVNILPKELLISELCNDDNIYARELKKIGFMLSEFGIDFTNFIDKQKDELHSDLEFWIEKSLQFINPSYSVDMLVSDENLDRHFRIEFLENDIFCDYLICHRDCANFLQKELDMLQKFLILNFQNTIMLTLQRLNFEVENALAKHKTNPDTLPLYNPTLENVRDLINIGFHFLLYQEKLSLNFPLYKKALWNITQELTNMYENKKELINQWIDINIQKYNILQNCENIIKNYKNT